jgi:tyrosyl-tRNA synthetase
MSKSVGNYIGIAEPPTEIYGKVMSLPDSAMPNYAKLVTRWTPEEIEAFEADLQTGRIHPRDVKMRLAWEITSSLCGNGAADEAQARFRRVFQRGAMPDDMPDHRLDEAAGIVDLLRQTGLVSSSSEGRRLVQQGGVRLDGEKVMDIDFVVEVQGSAVLRVGRRRFVRLTGP